MLSEAREPVASLAGEAEEGFLSSVETDYIPLSMSTSQGILRTYSVEPDLRLGLAQLSLQFLDLVLQRADVCQGRWFVVVAFILIGNAPGLILEKSFNWTSLNLRGTFGSLSVTFRFPL